MPRAVIAIEHPAPIVIRRQEHPHGLPKRTSQVSHRCIHCYHQIELFDQRGGIGEIVDGVGQVMGLQRATGLRELVARRALLQRKPLDVRYLRER